ncbi:MAG: phosphotransferase, partial [Candidatus Eremiobacteraeota bacterium]|nr:phosphotransferase [Candidatus Eremiobacteraeota bacterium]
MYVHDEFDVTGDVARHLIASQFPQLVSDRVTFLDRGMDNAVFRAGDVVFRFPVRKVAAEILQTEIDVMPRIAAQLNVAVSAPHYVGAPTDSYPFTFAGFPYIAGVAASDCNLSDAQRALLTMPVAQFLRKLHALDQHELAVSERIPPDTIGRLNHSIRYPLVASRISRLGGFIDPGDASL